MRAERENKGKLTDHQCLYVDEGGIYTTSVKNEKLSIYQKVEGDIVQGPHTVSVFVGDIYIGLMADGAIWGPLIWRENSQGKYSVELLINDPGFGSNWINPKEAI